ncbi:MAG: RNA methyltransferase [Acidobacteriota bacterium]
MSNVIFGFHPVREALRHRAHAAREVLVSAKPGKRVSEIESLAARHGVALRRLSEPELREQAGPAHNGFALLLSERADERSGVGAPGSRVGDADFVVLMEDIQDPRNLGALLRVFEGSGVGRVLLRDRGSAPLNEAASKTAAGADQWIEVERVVNSAQEITRLKDAGYWVYGCDAEGLPPWEIDLTGPVLICLGGEHKGLRPRTRDLCDGLIGLPMRGHVESLNVSTAASAILYEAVRQRMGGSLDRV